MRATSLAPMFAALLIWTPGRPCAAEVPKPAMPSAKEIVGRVVKVVAEPDRPGRFFITIDKGRRDGIGEGREFFLLHAQRPGLVYFIGRVVDADLERCRAAIDDTVASQDEITAAIVRFGSPVGSEAGAPAVAVATPVPPPSPEGVAATQPPPGPGPGLLDIASRIVEVAEDRNWTALESALDEWSKVGGTSPPKLQSLIAAPRERFGRWLGLQNAWRGLRDDPPSVASRSLDLAPLRTAHLRLTPAVLAEARRIVQALAQIGDERSASAMADNVTQACVTMATRLMVDGRIDEASEIIARADPFVVLAADAQPREVVAKVREAIARERTRRLFNELNTAMRRADHGAARVLRSEIAAALQLDKIAITGASEEAAILRRVDVELSHVALAEETEKRARTAEAAGNWTAAITAWREYATACERAHLADKAASARARVETLGQKVVERQHLDAALATLNHAELAIRNQMVGDRNLSRSNAKKWEVWFDDFARKNEEVLAKQEKLRTRLGELRQFVARNTSTSLFGF